MSKRRLRLLATRYDAHVLLNSEAEKNSMRNVTRHFTNLIKVDNHVHTSSASTAQHLLDYVKRQYHEKKDVVVLKGGVTLGQVIEKVSPKVDNLTLDLLGMNDGDTFGRFDKWNKLYLPFQNDEMRQVFLRRENEVKGTIYAGLIKEIVHERDHLVHTELRVTVRGSSPSEWADLARWITDNDLHKLPRNAWVVQVPRAFRVLRKEGLVSSFGELLENLFRPLFEVFLCPSKDPKLYEFLFNISGFDSVDTEDMVELNSEFLEDPFEWARDEEPPYAYWLFFLKANITTLNKLKQERGFRPFALRPHAGATGPISHVCAAFLLSDSITHGLTLSNSTALRYCFYLAQVGICMAVLAENALYCKIRDSPFWDYFKTGMVLSISTDNPRAIHLTPEPLMEEFATVTQIWRLRMADQAELCRNSILISGFSESVKRKWLGDKYFEERSNDPHKSGISPIRYRFRMDSLRDERKFVIDTACNNETDETYLATFSKFSF